MNNPTFSFDTYVERGRYAQEWPVAVTYTCDLTGKVLEAHAYGDDGESLTTYEWWQVDDEIEDRVQSDLAQWLADQDEDHLARAAESYVPGGAA